MGKRLWDHSRSFRTRQALYDLMHHVRRAPRRVLSGISEGGEAALDALIADYGCKIGTDAHQALVAPLLLAAASPELEEAFNLATAILIANMLQDGYETDTLDWHWEAHRDHYRSASPKFRAALMRGYLQACEARFLPLDPAPDPADLVTTDPAPLLPQLRQIAKAVTPAELDMISRADYGCDADKHLKTLKQIIWDQDCVFREGQHWYPSEVIELVAHVPNTIGFIPCTAILLINALEGRDNIGWFEFRWENHAPAYRALPEDVRAPILAGIRFLYETDPDFLSFWTKDFLALGDDWLIPVVADDEIEVAG